MNAFFTAAKEKLIIYWMLGLHFMFFTIVSLAFAIVGALYGFSWSESGGQDKFIILCLIVGNWGTTMMAFLSKAAAKVAQGELPIDIELDGQQTTVVRRQRTETETKTVATIPPVDNPTPIDEPKMKDVPKIP